VTLGEQFITNMQALLADVATRHDAVVPGIVLREMAAAAAAVMLIEMASREAAASMSPGARIAAALAFQDAATSVLDTLHATTDIGRASQEG
jgi:hypothetical protein